MRTLSEGAKSIEKRSNIVCGGRNTMKKVQRRWQRPNRSFTGELLRCRKKNGYSDFFQRERKLENLPDSYVILVKSGLFMFENTFCLDRYNKISFR